MSEAPSAVIARAMSRCPHAERGLYLRELLANVAAGLVVAEGSEKAAEAVYRLADAVVSNNRAGE